MQQVVHSKITLPVPDGYTRARTYNGERYIAKDDGSNPLKLVGGEWVEYDDGYVFPHLCPQRPPEALNYPMFVLSGNPCQWCGA